MNTISNLTEVQDITSKFQDWFDNHVQPQSQTQYPFEFNSWKQELDLIQNRLKQPNHLRIALVGTTGAGKSTFLNAVLGQEILPVGVMSPCTSFATSVTHSSDNEYTVSIQFCTKEEWENDLKIFIAAFQPEDDDSSTARIDSNRQLEVAKKRLKAVFSDSVFDNTHPENLTFDLLPTETKDILSNTPERQYSFDDSKEMLEHLRKLVRGDNSLWPLIKEVKIKGSYPCLEGGIEFVDLPGLNDSNEARVEVTREYLKTSPFVWILFSMVRGITNDIQKILLEEKLLQMLVLSGVYHSLSLIGTKADDIDCNIANQFGLPGNCEFIELIQAYRTSTVDEARKQLIEMIKQISQPGDDQETLDQLVETARNIRIHTTSATAYCKLQKIGLFRKDYGIDDIDDTGIPDIHKYLIEIHEKSDVNFMLESAIKRIDQLASEIEFFFRGQSSTPSPEVVKANTQFAEEQQRFSNSIQSARQQADLQLKAYRDRFLEKIDPLFASSVSDVAKVVNQWKLIQWNTLRAIVQRDGIFKSPTSGKLYNLNEDLTEPLLNHLPVTWEKYFTVDLGSVTDQFVIRVQESVKSYCEKISLITKLLFNQSDHRVQEQLEWFQQKIEILANETKKNITSAVRERRRELAANMTEVAATQMHPAYQKTKNESGPGMKDRILNVLSPAAIEAADPIYETINTDLLDGLQALELILIKMFKRLTTEAEEHAKVVSHNANIGIDESTIDPQIQELINKMPKKVIITSTIVHSEGN